MGWLDKFKGWLVGPFLTASEQYASEQRKAQAPRQDLDFATFGEPLPATAPGKLLDPQGKRVHHEYFVGEDRGDGHFPWTCRVYDAAGLRVEKEGLATSHEVSAAQAMSFAERTKQSILGEQS